MDEKQEPSILDLLKSSLPGQQRIHLPEDSANQDLSSKPASSPDTTSIKNKTKKNFSVPLLIILAAATAIAAQFNLEPRTSPRSWNLGAMLYLISALLLIFAIVKKEIIFPSLKKFESTLSHLRINPAFASISITLAIVSYFLFKGGLFTTTNLLTWLLSILFMLIAIGFFDGIPQLIDSKYRAFFSSGARLKVKPIHILLTIGLAVAIWFRFYLINDLPAQMVSDQAEKLLDVFDITQGKWPVFFPRNTGREFFQFYWTVLISQVFHTGISFLSLKLGTIILGVLTLPFVYLLGKELWNERAGLFGAFLCGIAYWPNVISRFALRFTLYPTFVAPTLYFLIVGMRKGSIRHFALSGLFLGLGLHGYTPFRIVPLVVLAAFAIYLLVTRQKGRARNVLYGLLIVIVISALVLLPLIRYGIDNPDIVWYRVLTRVSDTERQIEGSVLLIFLKNIWRALTMFYWENGNIWVVSVPNRPALDFISAALLFIGTTLVIARFIRNKQWAELFLLLSIPLLLLPSTTAIAFPDENPNLNRTSGAIIPVFLIAGFGLERIYSSIRAKSSHAGRWIGSILVGIFLLLSINANYDLVFNQYRTQFDNSAWKTSEMGFVARSFIQSTGNSESVYVVRFPYWADTRLVGMNAGIIGRDIGIPIEEFSSTVNSPSPKLFFLSIQDQSSVDSLSQLYPNGKLQLHKTNNEGKDYLTFMVP